MPILDTLFADQGLKGGGEIDGDLTITGDFVVEGGGSLTVDAAVTGNVSIVNDDNLQLKLDCHHDTDDKEGYSDEELANFWATHHQAGTIPETDEYNAMVKKFLLDMPFFGNN